MIILLDILLKISFFPGPDEIRKVCKIRISAQILEKDRKLTKPVFTSVFQSSLNTLRYSLLKIVC